MKITINIIPKPTMHQKSIDLVSILEIEVNNTKKIFQKPGV